MFKEITFNHWRQFNNVHLALDDRMTILTGENGTGKTTILNILSKHFGWNLQLISTPLPVSKRRAKQIWTDVWKMYDIDFTIAPGSHEIGSIEYQDGHICKLMVPPPSDKAQYNLKYTNQQGMSGLHIPSHRPPFSYHRITNIPADPKTVQQQYQDYHNILLQLYQSERSQNPGSTLKQSLIALALFGYGNEALLGNPDYQRTFEEFQEVLRLLLPKVLGFKKLEIRMPDIVLITDSGDFSLDAASGGIGAIVGIAWQIYMYGEDKSRFVVTFDEPEDHLHPSMQRELLPKLIDAFPNTQFIVATHSPFIATSSPLAKVYALAFNDENRVDSLLLDQADLSGTANETLREILGVPLSIPIWAEDRLKAITNKYRDQELTSSLLHQLRNDLRDNHLGLFLPDALSHLGGGDA